MNRAFDGRIGTLLGGRYELLAVLGSGGQSAVHRARDRRDGDEVAVKVLLPTTDPAAIERMYTRGLVHRDIEAPNVWMICAAHGGGVRLLDFGLAKLTRNVAITDADAVARWPSSSFFRLRGGRVPFRGAIDLRALQKGDDGAASLAPRIAARAVAGGRRMGGASARGRSRTPLRTRP